MASSKKDNKKINSEEEIAKLEEILLRNERKFDEELQRVGKNRIGPKTVLSLLIIFCSLFYYLKTRDQSLIELNENLNKESKLKDDKIDSLSEQLALKDRQLNAVLQKSESTERKIKDLNEKIALKDKTLEELVFDFENKNNKTIDLENNFIKIQTKFNDFKTNCLKKDKQIEELSADKQLKDQEIDKFYKKFNHLSQIANAQNSTAQVLYSSNETTATVIIELFDASIRSEFIYSCFEDNKEFDSYKNCFRDLTIVLHNLLYERINDSYWLVSTGTVDHCFTINVINQKDMEQYFFIVGDIFVEVFKYPDIFFEHQTNSKDIQLKETQKEDKPLKEALKEDIPRKETQKEEIPLKESQKEDIPHK